ncbi:hypothetical protein JOQ06_003490, partial [Pogonophryne albipinna]
VFAAVRIQTGHTGQCDGWSWELSDRGLNTGRRAVVLSASRSVESGGQGCLSSSGVETGGAPPTGEKTMDSENQITQDSREEGT